MIYTGYLLAGLLGYLARGVTITPEQLAWPFATTFTVATLARAVRDRLRTMRIAALRRARWMLHVGQRHGGTATWD